MTNASDIFRQAFDAGLKEFESRAKAYEADERAYKLRRIEHDQIEKAQLATIAAQRTEIQESAQLLENAQRERELLLARTRGECAQLLDQARAEADRVRAKIKQAAKDLEAA